MTAIIAIADEAWLVYRGPGVPGWAVVDSLGYLLIAGLALVFAFAVVPGERARRSEDDRSSGDWYSASAPADVAVPPSEPV